ncbi:ATP-binding Cassette (ABC) Superfamily, partial [Thraustotheca clavata]
MVNSSKYQSVSIEKHKKLEKHPFETVNFLSRWTYAWANPLMTLGNQRQLEPSDLWPLQHENLCENVSNKFLPMYQAKKSIIKAFLAVFGWQALYIGLMQFIAMVCTLYGPVVLQQVVSAVETSSTDFNTLLIPIVTLFIVKVAQAIIQTQTSLQNEMLYVKFTSALQDVLYRKTMVLNAKSRRVKSTGEVSNLFTSDMMWILSVSFTANQIWIIPLQITTLMYMLWQILGSAMFCGLGVMLVTLLMNRFLATLQRDNWKTMMDRKDARMKTVNEVFGSMQVIKLNAWEERYYDKIHNLRALELKSLWRQFCLSACVQAMNYVAPVLLTTVSFAAYVLWFDQTLTASKVFTALSLFNMIKAPMMRLPQIIANWMQAFVSYARFKEYMALEERDDDAVSSDATLSSIDIQITDGSFGYDKENALFSNVNLEIRTGEFIVIHGSVGEGKSSLCNAILGEMDKFNGKVVVNGRIAYFAQQPWIQNMTIRENILFGHPYDRKKYNAVLEA